MLKDEKEVMLLLLSNTYTRTKFSCVTMNSQNQDPPPPLSMQVQLSLIVVNNCFYPSQVTTLENVKGEFESFGELPSERETAIENRNSTLKCVSRK